ncbi:GntR family transcriptional regulator [Actinokineospora enzanensis]|uniref:GntR family transcriptional regulator n=1 Tax=Actinokineospora enzanensis TaxID=155975 RepID=UPI00146AD691|nr:GntR family transcriptional regulator [Actinokineospora enzanensis]
MGRRTVTVGPKYVAIQRDLVRRIGRAEFRVGAALPSQRELSQEYGVSLMTLRQALSALEEQGIVEQVTGRGTFVRAHRVPYPATGLGSIADELAVQGIAMSTRVLRVAMASATAPVADRLGVLVGEPVLEVERLRLVGELPVVHQVSAVPGPFAEALADADFDSASLYGLLAERCGAIPVRAAESITPLAIDAGVAGLLGVEPGALGLRSDRLASDAHDTALVYDRAVLVSERMVVTIERELSAAGSSFQYRVD